ncbi:uncharacterized protein [Gossypium hirsutum]|uniref:Retrovirus-related Pol polyprotein from transposon TNT 1-94 n=1 Tax=Gossypium hirsutum TaxID=3635 RepID=A0ABM3AEM2_GOSHI|nr:uncharacterized protein LOC121219101 [Gossypium hirsutum]
MDSLSSPSDTQSATPTMASNLTSSVVDSRFFSTKKVSVLLDDSNYLLWKQVFLAVKAYKLQSFLDLHTVPPPSTIPDDNGVPQENFEFVRFEQQDSALASWLLSSVSQAILAHLIGLDTSAQIWNAIVSLYGSKSTSRLMFYRRALHSQCKGDLSMREFLMKVKLYCDNLASYREVISEHEHVTTILNGLLSEYESIVSIIVASQVPYSLQSVVTMLVDAESRQQVVMAEIPSSANLVSQQPAESVPSEFVPSYRPSASRGCGRGRFSGTRFQCQLCGKTGHLVDYCYYRFDASYKSNNYKPPPQANACMYAPGSSFWTSPAMMSPTPVLSAPPPNWSYQIAPLLTGQTLLLVTHHHRLRFHLSMRLSLMLCWLLLTLLETMPGIRVLGQLVTSLTRLPLLVITPRAMGQVALHLRMRLI